MNQTEEYVVAVNQFVGPSYEKGRIGFRFQKGVVPFVIGSHDGSKYHMEMKDLQLFMKKGEEWITPFEEYEGNLIEWGKHEVEVKLSRFMKKGLKVHRLLEERPVTVKFLWVGEEWNPKTRPTKRMTS